MKPTLRKVKAGGVAAGLSTLVTSALLTYVFRGQLDAGTASALGALVSALIVFGITRFVAWFAKETHAEEYAGVIEGALGLEEVEPSDAEEPTPALDESGEIEGAEYAREV